MKRSIILVFLTGFFGSYVSAQLKPNASVETYSFLNKNSSFLEEEVEVEDEDSRRGFTFGIDLGAYLASKKTANIYNGAGGRVINNQALWNSIPERFTEIGINTPVQVINDINAEYPEYGNTVSGFFLNTTAEFLPADMNYNPRLFFGLNATYHLNDYWAIMAKSSVANLKSTAVYTMVLEGPTIPANANDVRQQFDLTGEEQRIHFDLGFKNSSYNDYGFKWFWGGGISGVGSRIQRNTAFIGSQRYELLIQNNGNQQFVNEFNANQTVFNIGFFLNTGWEMEYKDRYDFGLGFHLSRDPIELGNLREDVYNIRIFITFGI